MKIAIIGLGGHGRVVAEILRLQFPGVTLLAVDGKTSSGAGQPADLPIIGDDAVIETLRSQHGIEGFAIGVGALDVRERLFQRCVSASLHPITVIHPRAIVSPSAALADGTQVFPGAIVNAFARIDANTIINSGAIIEHDSTVGPHSHLAPNCTICGGCRIGRRVLIGAGATLLGGITIHEGATIGAGAVVLTDVRKGETVCGVPAVSIHSAQ